MRWRASVATTGSTSASPAPANSARSEASCAIFVPDGVTRWSKSRAAISRWAGRQRLDRPLEVIGHDLAGAAERIERLDPQRRRPRRALDVPHALHDELEVRRLDAARRPVFLDRSDASGAELDPPRADAVQDALDEHVLGDDVLALEFASSARAAGRSPPGLRCGRVGRAAGRCANRLGMSPLSRSSRASVSSRSERSTFTRSGRFTISASARSKPPVVAVVGEVLLRLVEDHVDVALGLRALADVEQLAVVDLRRVGERGGETVLGVVAPAREDDDERLLGQLAQLRATAARSSDDLPTPLGP